MTNESNFCRAEMEANCSSHQARTTIQSTPEKVKIVNKRSPSPNLSSPNKRIKSGKQLMPIGIASITSPNKKATKKTSSPQKNTILNYFPSPSKICISPNSKTEMCKINSQKVVKVLFSEDEMPSTSKKLLQMNKPSDLTEFAKNGENSSRCPSLILVADSACGGFPVKDELELCEMHKTPEKLHGKQTEMMKWCQSTWKINSQYFPESLSSVDFPSDDDIELCEMPDTPEKLQQMEIEMYKWREKMSRSSYLTEFDKNEENSSPSSPSILVVDVACGGFPVKNELEPRGMHSTPEKVHGQQSEMMKWGPSTSKSEIRRINSQCTPEKVSCVDFPDDDDLEQCEMPDTPEKLHAMQTEMNKWRERMSQSSDSTELDEDEYREIIENDPEPIPTELPDHVMENIFCRLPIRKLCKEANRVCKRWNEIISNHHFIPWKKFYFKLKFDDKTVNEEIAKICLDQNMAHNTLCFVGVIRYMKGFFTINKSDSLLPAIKKHSKYSSAISLLTDRVPDCIENEVPYVGSVIAALCILCSDTRNILEILNCLTHHKSKCFVVDALECLYCLATLFYYFKRNFSINPGIHYRVYYALHHFESGSDLAGIQIDNSVQKKIPCFTHEQYQIINHPLGPNQVVKIVAFAGTGKTTTLVEFTKMWPRIDFLNVCFNKSVEINAEKIFPKNVKSKTAHSLAHEAVGIAYRNKGKLPPPKQSKLFPYKFTKYLDGDNKLVRAAIALKTIEHFVCTADEFITTAHVPNGKKIKDEFVHFTIEEKIGLRNDAELIWKLMIDLNQPVQISHDVYLKLYQLSNPVISGYHCLLIDEAQDLNAAMTSFLLRQSYSKIIVGDPNQQVYSFRGAVDTINSIQCTTHVYYLTQSFRFGPEIAYLASCTLETLKQEHKNTIVGTLKEGKISGETKGQIAILARTRVSLFKRAAKFCDENSVLRGGFVGGLNSYSYEIIVDIYNLYQRSKGIDVYIKNGFIGRFSTFKMLRDFAENTDDIQLLGNIMIVECYQTSIPQIMEKLHQQCHHTLENADVIFSTTHKAKGHEFDTVILTDDYIGEKVQNKNGVMTSTEDNDDESNILYVALTRAKHRLVISNPVVEMLLVAGERFEHFISIRDIESKKCFKCQDSVINTMKGNFTLERQKIVLSSDVSINGGCLCFKCATDPILYIPAFASLWTKHPTAIDNVHCSIGQLLGPT